MDTEMPETLTAEEGRTNQGQTEGIHTMSDFVKIKQQLIGDLGALKDYCLDIKFDSSIPLIENTINRLHSSKFTIVVVGDYKAGKSSFVNALLGEEVFPVDARPATSTLCRATYGLDKSAEVIFKDGSRKRIRVDELERFVTKLHDGGEIAKTIEEVVVYYPSPYLMNNVDIIDTPGMNEEKTMTETSFLGLSKATVVILVILGRFPLGEFQRSFIEKNLSDSDIGKLIFVMSCIDQMHSQEDVDKMIRYNEHVILDILERAKSENGEDSEKYKRYISIIGRKPRIFGISSIQFLDANKLNDTQLLKQSRFDQFRYYLERFLTRTRAAIILNKPIWCIITTVNDALRNLAVQEAAQSMSESDINSQYKMGMLELDEVESQTQWIQDSGVRCGTTVKAAKEYIAGIGDRVLVQRESDKSDSHLSYSNR